MKRSFYYLYSFSDDSFKNWACCSFFSKLCWISRCYSRCLLNFSLSKEACLSRWSFTFGCSSVIYYSKSSCFCFRSIDDSCCLELLVKAEITLSLISFWDFSLLLQSSSCSLYKSIYYSSKAVCLALCAFSVRIYFFNSAFSSCSFASYEASTVGSPEVMFPTSGVILSKLIDWVRWD